MHYREIGSFEAKTHFSQILAEVANGDEFIITKHGKRVAILSVFNENEQVDPVQNAITTITNLRKNIQLNSSKKIKELSIKEMIEEGRK
jgi:prevent-host-death family protein